ncbi:hypothetical protein LSTR_LSTR003598 [Laodelphax striatellus]|uniref:BZIP domain-containing protein n=1 Tax=Laodelphax striatellus TaxID=195883 RepID=A0A482WL58_LAOST|nr:hypothetical protein LSTR_LSTR003598 [Laodelphax striatellus]
MKVQKESQKFVDSREREQVLSEQGGAGGCSGSRKSSESSGRGSSSGEEEEEEEERERRGEESGQDGGDEDEEEEEKKEKEEETDTGFASPSSDEDLDEISDFLFGMIQTPQFHHGRSFQGRMPYVRTMSMEQRWQDLASLLSLPDPNHPYHHHYHHPHHHAASAPYPGSYLHPHAAESAAAAARSGGGSSALHLTNAAASAASLPPPPPLTPADAINSSSAYPTLGSNGNFGSAVATSMNLTNSSEPTVSEATGASFKMENHESLYYSPMCPSDSGNNTSEMNHTTDGFLSSILNDEDIQLMDMAMNEGMYTMRMLEGGNGGVAGGGVVGSCGGPAGVTERGGGTDSDSAVSSMGSERVPSLSSDTEWMETNSDSGHTPGDHYNDYHSKYRWYDYSYPNRHHASSSDGVVGSASSRIHPVAQKKHHMYGKRFFQEQGSSALGHASGSGLKYDYAGAGECAGDGSAVAGAVPPPGGLLPHYPGSPLPHSKQPPPPPPPPPHPEMKYSCSLEFSRQAMGMMRTPMEHVAHNHTYHLPPEQPGLMQQRPMSREKHRGKKAEDEHLTRDEKRARALNVPITVNDIINLPMDEFNERLSKYDLSESQLSLIRDIRRRGKNKVAAQNCRKRKLDQIMSLADEVKEMRDRKQRLLREHDFLIAERQRVKNKFSQLYRHIFQLRDVDGNPYSPYEWSLQQAADGSVMLVPRSAGAGAGAATSLLEQTDTRPPGRPNKEPDPDHRKQS